MAIEAIECYFRSNVYKPFYMVVGDSEYRQVKTQLLEEANVDFVCISDYCRGMDKKPDLDRLKETLRMADIDCQSNRVVVLGLGEYLALEGANKAYAILNELLSFNLGSAHVVFLLRGVSLQVKNIMNEDVRLAGRQIELSNDMTSTLVFKFGSMELKMYENDGIAGALRLAESGEADIIQVNSSCEFPNSLYTVQIIKNPYEAISKIDKTFNVPKAVGSDDEWSTLLREMGAGVTHTVEYVFSEHGFDDSLFEFHSRISGHGYKQWLYYLYLLINGNSIGNVYLRYVLENSDDFDGFQRLILNAISDVSHTDPVFNEYYFHRKILVSQYPESEIACFVSNNRLNPDEGIYKLTDNTQVEREEIIAQISQIGKVPDELEVIYPDLFLYLKKYHFSGDALSELLTDYFDAYKRQKVLNRIEASFENQVNELAKTREYNRLRTRDEIIANIGRENAYLYWIDALGVEYLSYIVNIAQKKGLSVSVNIGRSDLPTITSINRHFFETWPEDAKIKIEELDDVKHSERGGYKYGPSNLYPIHLAKELRIISNVIEAAAIDLGLRKYERCIIASDHGASRLAVISNREEKYDTDTQGEHSGRCCKSFVGYELPFATEENGYIVLADYGRFKKSRAANVEVHGGASLEEVLVPIVSLSLKDASIVIKPVENVIKVDYKTGAVFILFINKPTTNNVSVEYKGKRYQAERVDDNHYKVDVSEIKRAGNVEVDVYIGEDLVSHIVLKAVGKSATMNSDFDELM